MSHDETSAGRHSYVPGRAVRFTTLALLFLTCWVAIELHAAPPICISTTHVDIDGDRKNETIEILLEDGRRFVDENLWCGMGEKWEGKFTIRVRDGEVVLQSQSLNELMDCENLWFRCPEFPLAIADYNADGRVDFNLGQYASCNHSFFQLFTVAAEGKIEPMRGAAFYIFSHENSTEDIIMDDGLVGFQYYTQDNPPVAIRWFAWNGWGFEEVRATFHETWWRAPDSP